MSARQPHASIAIIGGSGFYDFADIRDIETIGVDTPFGAPSDNIVLGTLGDARVAFLPRHGAGHRILPGELPQRANIWALASLGVERIISVTAVGSLREEIAPLDMITPYTPEEKWSGGIQYTFGTGARGEFTVRLDAAYQSEQYADATNKALNRIDSYTLYNAMAWWESPDNDWRIQLEWLNLSDKVYYIDLYDVSASQGTVLAQPGLPETFNISFTRNF